jgi:hypothetical protein
MMFFVLATALLPFSPVEAGMLSSDDASCSKPIIVDGSSVSGCQGTMKGFRDNVDPLAYVGLRYRANGTMFFEARLNGVLFSCFFPDTYDAQYFASIAGDFQHGRFAISQKGGLCNDLSLVERGSFFSSY